MTELVLFDVNEWLRWGGQTALYDSQGNKYSYAELYENTLRLSAILHEECLSQSVVAIFSEKKIQVPLFIYSVLYAGLAYMPVDSRNPSERMLHIIRTAQPSAIIVQQKLVNDLVAKFNTLAIDFKVVNFYKNYQLIVLTQSKKYPKNSAYLLFTSGSTGIPKGILHSHIGATTFINWARQTLEIKQSVSAVSIAPFQFDLSVFDLFYPTKYGGSLLILSDIELANSRIVLEQIVEHQIDTIYSTPSFFDWILTTTKPERYNLSHVHTLLIAGELLTWQLAKRLRKCFAESAYWNLYGPTETNVCTAYQIDFEMENVYSDSVPIGNLCSWADYLLKESEHGKQLLISGDGVMTGYIDGDDFEKIGEKNYYNTKDIVELVSPTLLAYTGRVDRMIKKNGFRIEPAEIEKCLTELNGVKQCITIPIVQNDSTKLVAFVVSDITHDFLSLKEYCSLKVPYYMVPDNFIFVEEIPLNAHHKTDVAALLKLYYAK